MYLKGQLFSGIAFDSWPNGALASEVEYRDGVEDGWCVAWYPNGGRMSEVFYVAGKARGLRREWHENGVLKLEARIGDHAECLERSEWDSSGRLTTNLSKS